MEARPSQQELSEKVTGDKITGTVLYCRSLLYLSAHRASQLTLIDVRGLDTFPLIHIHTYTGSVSSVLFGGTSWSRGRRFEAS